MAKQDVTGTAPVNRESEVTGIVAGVVDHNSFEDKPAPLKGDTRALRDLSISKLSLLWNQTNTQLLGRDMVLMVCLQGTGQYVEAELDKSKIPWMKRLKGWLKNPVVKMLSPLLWLWNSDLSNDDPSGLRGCRVAMAAAEGNKYIVTKFLDGDANESKPQAATEPKQ